MARRNRASVEKETVKRVDQTIKKIEKFLKKWDDSEAKPDQMLPEIGRLKEFRQALLKWKKDAGKSRSEADKERLIREFVLICNTYS